MRKVGGDDRMAPDRAQAGNVGSTVDLAGAGADHAPFTEQLVRLNRTPFELRLRERDAQHVRCSAAAELRGSSSAYRRTASAVGSTSTSTPRARSDSSAPASGRI